MLALSLSFMQSSFAGLPAQANETRILERENWNVQGGNWLEDEEARMLWVLPAGESCSLEIAPGHALFPQLRFFDRLEFEFRIVSGQLERLSLEALGHVSGIRSHKKHQWNLAMSTTATGVWHFRTIDLARPNWFPFDNPDGDESHFRLSALAALPDTVIELRNAQLIPGKIFVKPFFENPITWPIREDLEDGSIRYEMRTQVLNATGKRDDLIAEIITPHSAFEFSVEPAEQQANSAQSVTFTLQASLSAEQMETLPDLYAEELRVRFYPKSDPEAVETFTMMIAKPVTQEIRQQLYFSEEDLEYLRSNYSKGNDEILQRLRIPQLLSKADQFLEIDLVRIPGGHSHPRNSYPPVPGSQPARQFQPGETMPTVVDPETGEMQRGTPIAENYWKEHLGYSGKATENLGLAYAITGDEKYAEKAVDLMRLYAEQYNSLHLSRPFESRWGGGPSLLVSSRAAGNSTYGTNWYFKWHMRMLALIGESEALTPEAREMIYKGFVIPYATELIKFKGGISNMTDITSHNLLVLGLLFDDATILWHALHADPALLSRLNDLDKDGFSSEGRPINYHHAAMDEYLPALTYLENSGLAVDYAKDNLLAAVRMPYERATLWRFIPNTGDVGRGRSVARSTHADHLLVLFPDEEWLLDIGAGRNWTSRIRRLQEGFTADPDAVDSLLSSNPVLFEEAGLILLRTGDTPANQIMVTLDYGNNPMHAHLDRNQVTLSAFGKVFSHGPGTLYNAGRGGILLSEDPKLSSFINAGSLGQNIILVNAQNQARAIGQLEDYAFEEDRQWARSRVNEIAPGVAHTRTVVLQDGLVILVDDIESSEQNTYDFVYHNFGILRVENGWEAEPQTDSLAETANYPSIQELTRWHGSGPLQMNWDLSNQVHFNQTEKEGEPIGLRLLQIYPDGAAIYTGTTGLINPNTWEAPGPAPSLITRTDATHARFVTLLEPYKESPSVEGIELKENDLRIQRHGAEQTILLPLK